MEEFRVKYEFVFKKTERTPILVRIPEDEAEALRDRYPYGFHFVGDGTIKYYDEAGERWSYEDYDGCREVVRLGDLN